MKMSEDLSITFKEKKIVQFNLSPFSSCMCSYLYGLVCL